MDHSQSSKHLACRSRHKHQNKQCGTNLHKSILRCLPNLPCQEANNSLTLYGITQWIPKKTKNHGPQLISYRTMKEKVIHRFPSTFTLVTRIDDLIMYQFDVQFLCKVWKIKDKEQELLNMKISIFSIYFLYIGHEYIYIYIYITYQESNEG